MSSSSSSASQSTNQPAKALPGSREKIEIMAARARLKLPLDQSDDFDGLNPTAADINQPPAVNAPVVNSLEQELQDNASYRHQLEAIKKKLFQPRKKRSNPP